MRSRLGTVAQNALTSNALPQASRRFTARTKWGRAFFMYNERVASCSRRARVGERRVLSRRVSLDTVPKTCVSSKVLIFSAAIIGRGEGTSPVLRKKARAIFQKSTTFVRNTWPLARNVPTFWGLIFSAWTKGTCRSSTLPEGENRRGRVAWLSPAHEIFNAY